MEIHAQNHIYIFLKICQKNNIYFHDHHIKNKSFNIFSKFLQNSNKEHCISQFILTYI